MKKHITILLTIMLVFVFSMRLIGACSAGDEAQLISCLNGSPMTITLTANISANLSGRSLNGFTIALGNNNLTITGNPSVNSSTSFTSSGNSATLTLTNNRNQSVSFNANGNAGFDLDNLNTAMVSGSTTLHTAATSAGATVLPVKLSGFDVISKQSEALLIWQTSTELNNAKFIIETSHQGETFQRIGEVAGAGTTTEPQNYSFTHHTPSAGINYYRLKQVDFDGTFEYSKVIAINAPGSNDVFAFPNPAREKISVQYDQSKGAGNIQLLDALGRRINANIAGYAGNYEVTLPESLARGTYWLKVERGGKVQTLPVVKE